MSSIAPSALLTPTILAELAPAARAVLPYLPSVWLRPEQRVETDGLRELGCLAGRGWGKTFALACVIVDLVTRLGAIDIGLMAPTEERVKEVQFKALIDASPPWAKPVARGDKLVWPNGAQAIMFTAREPERPRGGNFYVFWFTELVDWPVKHRREAWAIAAAATRKGPELLLWDTTAKGTNELIEARIAEAKRDPTHCKILRGNSFQNPMLSRKYLRSIAREFEGQRLIEELWGRLFDRAAGALWGLEAIELRRIAPRDVPRLAIKLWAHDPSFSDQPGADETGLVGAGRGADGAVYILRDESTAASEDWAATIVDGYLYDDYAGVVTETNKGGHTTRQVLIAECKTRTPPIKVEVLRHDQKLKPRMAGVLQVKEINTKNSKTVRGEGAKQFGNVRHAGTFAELEHELTTYDGTGPSPNRFDAFNYAVNELAELTIAEKLPPPPQNGYGLLVDAMRGTGRRSLAG